MNISFLPNYLLKFNLILLSLLITSGCGGGGGSDSKDSPIELKFSAISNGAAVGCDNQITGLGPNEQTSIGISDLRFYISNVRFYDDSGNELSSELDFNEYQYRDSVGDVALIDLTSNSSGSCTNTAISFSEGTARTNSSVKAFVSESEIAEVSFDVGIPQRLMKQVIANYTAEDAPSPLGELYWSWASGYRHFLLNFVVDNSGQFGEGYVHLGSRDCGGNGAQALSDREECGYINAPNVRLRNFNPRTQTIGVNINEILKNVVFDSSQVACHSAPVDSQPDCSPVFSNFGLDPNTGRANSELNRVFSTY
jgi:uncharacterized repeat protein (TIGR04052 family)